MNAEHIEGSDKDDTQTSSGVKGFIPDFAYNRDSGLISAKDTRGEIISDRDESVGSDKVCLSRVRGCRTKSKGSSAAFKEYWVDGVQPGPKGMDPFAAKAESTDALFHMFLDRRYKFYKLAGRDGLMGLKESFAKCLKAESMSNLLNNGGILLLNSVDQSRNMHACWCILTFAGIIGGYPQVWRPTEVMDAYKSDDLFRVANDPNVLVITLQDTDLDGSSATRRTHFLNNLSSIVCSRKGKVTVIAKDPTGLYPNTSTFETIKKTFITAYEYK